MKLCAVGLATATILGVASISTSSVYAAEVPKQSAETPTSVKFIDNPAPDPADLKLVSVPESYDFQTTLNDNGNYAIVGSLKDNNKNITVFNNKSTQSWSVKAAVDGLKLHDTKGNDASVTSFKINNQELVGQKADPIVHKSADNKTLENNTGFISKKVAADKLSIGFSTSSQKINVTTVFTGSIKYVLYDTPDAK